MRFRINTTIGGNDYTLDVPSARTVQEAINAFQQYFWSEYDYDPLGLPIPIDIKIINVND